MKYTVRQEVIYWRRHVAIDAARVSARCGSESVTMVCLEQPEEMPALPERVQTPRDGVSIRGWGPAFIDTDEQGHVCGVCLNAVPVFRQ